MKGIGCRALFEKYRTEFSGLGTIITSTAYLWVSGLIQEIERSGAKTTYPGPIVAEELCQVFYLS